MMYIVIGADGAELKSYKTLAAAKKLAEATEGAVVMYGGEQVYPSVSTEPSEPAVPATVPATDPADFTPSAEEDESAEEAEIVEEEKAGEKLVEDEKEAITEVGEKPVEKPTTPHQVLVRINIRSGPSLNAEKVGTADVGTILDAYEDLGDWLKIRWKGGVAYARHKNHEYVKEAK